ncbi:type IVB secretion system protein IcmH/DotU [Vibrio sp. S4M6]|uniref:type IVB secretion system protein IcmH/DotU n=1 Tax=Vibrio sinus TaxID=2946865 RepID=UPI00202A2B45|nr:type IVB secretion system protein IcmH/DotU [Vibrio sinus]MCL9780075.1 type IVB secretion system protein IcmH/DotU [Vibrio sinus]
MSYQDNDSTIVLYQPEAGMPMEVMPSPDLSRNIVVDDLEIANIGINPLVDQFSWLVAMLTCIPSIPWLDDPMPLREQMAREIRKGEKKLNDMDVDRASILVIRYCICAAIDESVCSQEWGEKSHWSQKSLLSEFHNETSGGEKLFLILERIKPEPKKYRYVIEFLYLILQLGFKGKFGREDNGKEMLAEIASTVYGLIRDYRLSEQEKSILKSEKALVSKTPLKRVIAPKVTLGIACTVIATLYLTTFLIIDLKFQQLVQLHF